MWDTLFANSKTVVEHRAGSTHPKFPNFIYPVDYGYLECTKASDSDCIDVWFGTAEDNRICGCIVTIDLLKRDSEVKILFACTPEEIQRIQEVHNYSDMQKGILILRED